MAYETQKDRFLAAVRERGGSAGNLALREELGWSETTYERVKQALLDSGRILPARGRGGSVRLVALEFPSPAWALRDSRISL